jgi:hypothetical protein
MRSSVIALAALATVPAAAPAAPFGASITPAVADNTMKPTLVGDGYQGNGRSGGPGYGIWPRNGRGWNGNGNWNGRGNWNGNGNWNGRRNWNGNWRGRHYRHGHYGHDYYGGNSGLFLGLGLGGLGYGLGYGSGYYNDPYYDEPVYRPRRVYRGAASTHVEWCYNRYRSYRAWDNSFQPYHGPRQQCYSPFS